MFSLESDFTPDRQRQLAGLRLILDDPALGRLFVVRLAGEVVGMANALITVSTAVGGRVLLLEDVILRRDQRGRGLVEHVLAWARAAGLSRATRLADQANPRALAFYARLGFESSNMRVLRQ